MGWMRRAELTTTALILGIAAGCAGGPGPAPSGASQPGSAPTAAGALGQGQGQGGQAPTPPATGADASPNANTSATPAAAAPPPAAPGAWPTVAGPSTRQMPRSRWLAADWADLPGFASDRLTQWWPAFIAGCSRPARPWSTVCAEAQLRPPMGEPALREWMTQHLQPWRVEPLPGAAEPAGGLLTGYFEPLIEARRSRQGAFTTPLHAAPADLTLRRPYWSRQELDTLPNAQAALRGREIAWVADPLDALVIQIQGSGRLWFPQGDGRQVTRLAFAGHNDQPYRSVGRWLIDQGELRPGEASWPAIKAWAQRNPQRVQEMLWANPRVVFFREEPLAAGPGSALPGPRGAQGIPLTAGRSIAVDPQSIPYGTAVWLDSTEPLSSTPLQRLVMAQDTGSAIVGAVRADFFWGSGDEAEAQAGRMKQALRLWVLWPKGAAAR